MFGESLFTLFPACSGRSCRPCVAQPAAAGAVRRASCCFLAAVLGWCANQRVPYFIRSNVLQAILLGTSC